MATEKAAKITDLVVAEMVECSTDAEKAFRAGYQAAMKLDYPGKIGAEEKALEEYLKQVNG